MNVKIAAYFMYLLLCWENGTTAAANQDDSHGCTTGFPNQLITQISGRAIRNDSVTVLIPEMMFTCNGTVTGFTVAGQQMAGPQDPIIQIWREDLSHSNQGVYYNTGADITINGTVCENGLVREGEQARRAVFHCNLSESFQVAVQAGDILGLEIPPRIRDDFVVFFAISTKAPENFVFESRPLASPVSLSNASSINYQLPQLTLQIESGDDKSTCTRGFPDVPIREVSAQTNSDFVETRLIPDMKFNCNATIFGFIVAGRALSASPHAKIQIWREISDNEYEIASEININFNVSQKDEERVCIYNRINVISNAQWCVLNDAHRVRVQPGDILGLELPKTDTNTASEIYFLDAGPENYVYSGLLNSSVNLLNETMFRKVEQLPQMAFNLTTDQCLSGFLANFPQLGSGRAENSVTTRLIPEMKFGCNGTIVGYKVVASPNRNGNLHPKIQIWRPNPTQEQYYKLPSDIPILSSSPPCVRNSYNNSLRLFQCILSESAQVRVQCGYILGLELPPMDSDRREIYHTSGGPRNLVFQRNLSSVSVVSDSEANFTSKDTPLITFLVAIDERGHSCPNAISKSNFSTTMATTTVTTKTTDSNKPSETAGGKTTPQTKGNGAIIGAVSTVVVFILLVVIIVLVLVIVYFVKKSKKHSQPSVTNAVFLNISAHSNTTAYNAFSGNLHVTTSNCGLSHSDDTHQFSVENNIAQPQDYCEISDEVKTVATTMHNLIPQMHSNYYCATPQPQEGEYEIPSEQCKEFQFQLDENNYAIQCDYMGTEGSVHTTDDADYWKPAATVNELYKQLSSKKYREIGRNQMDLTSVLGSGQFGEVHKGVWQSPMGALEVAVKQLQPGASEEEKVKFLQEAAINGQFRHPNVVQLMGVVTVGEPTMIVLELLSNGDLRSFLIDHRQQSQSMDSITVDKHLLLRFCQHIASGMSYLASKSFVHRDLAARNILVSKDNICKISDFGMSRDLMEGDYYVSHGGKVPVKWTAPEAIHYKKYSSASDVWSFGCVMYEIWSLGHKPFETQVNSEVVKIVDKGYRLPPPPGLSKELYKIMIQCWQPQTIHRPTFPQLVELLSRADFELFSWEEEDMVDCDPLAKVIGAPLEISKNLYKELQLSYQPQN